MSPLQCRCNCLLIHNICGSRTPNRSFWSLIALAPFVYARRLKITLAAASRPLHTTCRSTFPRTSIRPNVVEREELSDKCGVNVILCGDSQQFPSVAGRTRSALYHSNEPYARDTVPLLGRSIYERFTTVVVSRHRVRVSDPVWRDFLRSLRVGRVHKRHVTMLNEGIVVDHPAPRCSHAMERRHCDLAQPTEQKPGFHMSGKGNQATMYLMFM